MFDDQDHEHGHEQQREFISVVESEQTGRYDAHDGDWMTKRCGREQTRQTRTDTRERAPLVIPLITTNRYRDTREARDGKSAHLSEKDTESDGLQFETETPQVAPASLDGKKPKWGLSVPVSRHHDGRRQKTPSSASPILMQNRLPGLEGCRTDTERFALDMSLRPTEPTLTEYAAVPVAEFGTAMLRGMGWRGDMTDGSVGGTNSNSAGGGNIGSTSGTRISPAGRRDSGSTPKRITPIQYVPRPERLGLGASHAAEPKKRRPVEESLGIEMTKEEEKTLKRLVSLPKRRSDAVEVLSSQVNYVGIDDKMPKRLKLTVEPGVTVVICDGPHCNLAGRVVEMTRDGRGVVVRLETSDESVLVLKEHVRVAGESHRPANNQLTAQQTLKTPWLMPGLRVRVVSKHSFERGRFYNRRGVIVDVHSASDCTLQLAPAGTSVGELLHHVPQSALETIVPRHPDPVRATVRYLRRDGSDASWFHAPFRVLQLDVASHTAVIQLEDDPSTVISAKYDDICEFVPDGRF